MVGRKFNLNILVSRLWNVGATVVKTTEFVQGRTSRWGLAWSFLAPLRKMVASQKIEENNLSFMLEVKAYIYVAPLFSLFVLSVILAQISSHGAVYCFIRAFNGSTLLSMCCSLWNSTLLMVVHPVN